MRPMICWAMCMESLLLLISGVESEASEDASTRKAKHNYLNSSLVRKRYRFCKGFISGEHMGSGAGEPGVSRVLCKGKGRLFVLALLDTQ